MNQLSSRRAWLPLSGCLLCLSFSAYGGNLSWRMPAKPAPAPVTAPVASPAPAPAPVATSGATALPAAQTCGLPNFQQELINLINQARANTRMCGATFFNAAPAVQWNSKLFAAAAGHSSEMAVKNYFSHDSFDGTTPGDRLHNAGYAWSRFGENIAAGQTTVASVMQAWLNSPGHCENLMQPNVTEVGVSCARNDSATYRMYWTMDLAKPL